MQDRRYANFVEQVRQDLRQTRSSFPLHSILAGYEPREIHVHMQCALFLSYHYVPHPIDVGEWNEQPIRPSQYSNDEDGSFAWVAMNARNLYEQYGEQWILVNSAGVVGSASNP